MNKKPGRPKGIPKTGGRVAGTPNKRTTVKDLCEQMGVDPFAILLEMASKVGLYEEGIRFAATKELCQYLEPKLKSVEIKNAEGEGFIIKIEDYTKAKDAGT